ncbi:MAG: amidohydrolase family protein, partial [Gammaproteobacteria bacterium]|nr:amidohydrolase family protein [Gammaproteobacteria bacterium]
DQPLRHPRWSPDGQSLLYVVESSAGNVIMIHDLADSSGRVAGTQPVHSQDPSWHPNGEKFVFSSARNDSGLDLWETDLPTGLSWRLTSQPGDEYQPAWSANGNHLAWIHRDREGYSLMLRRRGEPEFALLHSEEPLSSPSWRPDGSLLTYLRHTAEGRILEMAILSEPLLVRPIAREKLLVDAPVSWPDRQRMFYTADRQIRTRSFDDRRSRPVHFRAFLEPVVAPPPNEISPRELLVTSPPGERLIIRSARLFDGIWKGYRLEMDVVMEDGKIVSVDQRSDRQDGTLLDLGNVTVVPGLIDADAGFGGRRPRGAEILAYGVTTIAVTELPPGIDPLAWESEATPGPRVIHLDADEIVSNVSGLADGGLENLDILMNARQPIALGHTTRAPRRFATMRDISDVANTIVAGSAANRIAPGAGLHAELLALRTAGLNGEQALHAAGRNAALALGVVNQIGTITPGALADLVLLSGDPLTNTGDLLKIVAVVRNGRFFSLVRLLESARDAAGVE